MKVTTWMTAAATVGIAVVPCGSLDWTSDKQQQQQQQQQHRGRHHRLLAPLPEPATTATNTASSTSTGTAVPSTPAPTVAPTAAPSGSAGGGSDPPNPVPLPAPLYRGDAYWFGFRHELDRRVILYISLYTPWCAKYCKHLCRASLDTTSGANSGDPFYFVSDYEPFCIADCASDCSGFYSDQWDGFSELSKDLFYMEYVGGKVPGGTVPGGNLP